jgi:hypothetical protein
MGPYAFVYQFDQCEFDFDSSYPSYASIDNKGGQAVSHQFKIHVGRVKDYKIQFNQLSDVLKKDNNIQQMVLSDIWGNNKDNYNDADYFSTAGIENVTFSDKSNPAGYFAGLASNFITNTVADLKNQGVSIAENKLMGNIYGFGGFNATQAASRVQSLVSTIDAGVPNPFSKNDPQSNGYGGPKERAYPSVNTDVYPNNGTNTNQTLGNVISGGNTNQPGLQTDVYGNVPGSDLGLPNRVYPVPPAGDEYQDVPGKDLGPNSRVYSSPRGDMYKNSPGKDLGLPGKRYPSAYTSDEYKNSPGLDLGVPERKYPSNI